MTATGKLDAEVSAMRKTLAAIYTLAMPTVACCAGWLRCQARSKSGKPSSTRPK